MKNTMKTNSMENRDISSSRYIGDFTEGDTYHHGAVQITPARNREYINKYGDSNIISANPALCTALGFTDPYRKSKKGKFGIAESALVNQGYLFNLGFGLSVHDISFNAIANLSYSNMRYGSPVFEGDIIYSKSEVLGIKFIKDSSRNGSVQIRTTLFDQNERTVLEYTREVLVRAGKGKTYNKKDTTQPQPERIVIDTSAIPDLSGKFDRKLLGSSGRTFEELEPDSVIEGAFEKGIDLADFTWLQISTLNDASVHHDPQALFIGYGGAVKARAEGQISPHFPLAFHLGMNTGAHTAPTYPSDMIKILYGNHGNREEHEVIRSHVRIKQKQHAHGRDDIGIATVSLNSEKYVTDAGMKALESAGFRGMDRINETDSGRILQVLSLEQVLAIPTERAFR